MNALFRFLRFIFLGVLIYILFRILKREKWFPSLFSKRSKGRPHSQSAIEELKKDPVCGAYMPEKLAVKYTKGDENWYFCSEECKRKFLELGK